MINLGISIFSHVIIRPNKLWTEPTNWAHFQKSKYEYTLKIKIFKEFHLFNDALATHWNCMYFIEIYNLIILLITVDSTKLKNKKSWSFCQIFFTEKNQKDSVDFCRKMTLKVQILQTLRRLLILLVGLKMTWFSEKCWCPRPIYAYVVWCPPWAKNLARSLPRITIRE